MMIFLGIKVPVQPLLQSVPMNFGHEIGVRECDVFFSGSPIWYLSPMYFMVSLSVKIAFLSSEDCPLDEQ